MGWPTPQEYNEAIQNERLCFLDDELQAGKVQLNTLGLPRAVTGSFASVYCLSVGSKKYAVRCFLHEIPDQQLRYQRLSTSICSDTLEYTVDFEFQQRGIRVRDEIFPVLKMEWVQGETLDVFARRNHQNKEALAKLQSDFRHMLKALSDEGFAHADLQHGNVLVSERGLRLVDYDGMFVPSLSGFLSNELGHRNYQHPGRTKDHFGPYLDNFSAWVIDTALTCLIEDNTLYETLKCGDEALLFHSSDFCNPEESEVFFTLEKHDSATIRRASRMLRTVLSCHPYNVPPLSDEVAEASEHPKVVAYRKEQEESIRRVRDWTAAAMVADAEAQSRKELAEQAAADAAEMAARVHAMPAWLDQATASVLTAADRAETAVGAASGGGQGIGAADPESASSASSASHVVSSTAAGTAGAMPPASVQHPLSVESFLKAMRVPADSFTGEFETLTVQTDKAGDPINYGSTHAVFHAWNQNRDAAIKFFAMPIERLDERYAAITDGIDKLPKSVAPYFLKCSFRTECITGAILDANGNPVEKAVPLMLSRWQDKAVRLGDVLRTGKPDFDWSLLNHFRRMCHAIQTAGVAHGSLDPDNILVLPDYQLVLVDYDNFYVPAMDSLQLRAAELAPPYLRHPMASMDDFGPFIDYFASWLIDTMLLVWSADRALWRALMINKGTLFFNQEDFAYPKHSPVLAALLEHSQYDISMRGQQLVSFLKTSPDGIPSLAKSYS